MMKELPIIEKTLNFIKWYVPLLNGVPRSYRFTISDRIINGLYDLMEGLVKAKYANQKLELLETLNVKLDLIRYQSRLLIDFSLISQEQSSEILETLQSIGIDLGHWIRYQQQQEAKQQTIEFN